MRIETTNADSEDAFVVEFDRRRLIQSGLISLIGGMLGALLALVALHHRGNLQPISVVAESVVFTLCFFLVGNPLRWARRPALVANREGLGIGFLPRRSFVVPWEEIMGVAVLQRGVGRQEVVLFAIFPHSENGFDRYVGSLYAQTARLAERPVISIGISLLKGSWEEIEDGINEFRPLGDRTTKEALNLVGEVARRSEEARTHSGQLVTLEDYRRVFRRAPLGNWSDSKYCVSPGDSRVAFCADGTAWVGEGASYIFGHTTDLNWRERAEDLAIDIQRAEVDATWITFDYDFFEENGAIVNGLTERFSDESLDDLYDPDEDLDEWTTAFCSLMSYGGPCRNDR